jgi:NADH-quinone oxidoreductase subunit N
MNWAAFAIGLLPEHFLLAGVLLLIVHAIVSRSREGAAAIALVSVGAAALAALWLGLTGFEGEPFSGQLSVSRSTSLGKALALALAWPVLLLARDDLGDGGPLYPLLVSSLYGLVLMLSSDSFLTLFLGLELMSLPVYVLVLIGLKRDASPEAALKYLVLGGAATATLLMGISLLYGGAGTLSLAVFAQALGGADGLARGFAPGFASGFAIAGAVLVLLAFFLKAAIVPFHAWAPDAYEGASLPVTAYMAAIVKAGVLLAALRLFGAASLPDVMVMLLALLPLASIVWGNLAAMRQPNLRRMMAYSSIAHAGYLYLAFLGDANGGLGRFSAVVLPVRLRPDDRARVRCDPGGQQRSAARPHRRAARPLSPAAVCRHRHRPGDAVAGRHSAAARLHRQVPDLPRGDGCRPHRRRGVRPGRQLPRPVLLLAGHSGDVHGRARSAGL